MKDKIIEGAKLVLQVIAALIAMFLALAIIVNLLALIYKKSILYDRTSDLAPEDCRICSEQFEFSGHWGSGNIGLLMLNSHTLYNIQINPWLPPSSSDLLNSYNGSAYMTFVGAHEETRVALTVIADRGHAYGTFEPKHKLDIDAVKENLCANCISAVLDKLDKEGRNSEVAFIHLDTREIVVVEPGMRTHIEDYFIVCTERDTLWTFDICYLPVKATENYVSIIPDSMFASTAAAN